MTGRAPPGGPASFGPFSGLTFWNTRESSVAPELTGRLERLGGQVLAQPTICHLPPLSWQPFDDALAALTPATWIVFTSATAVRFTLGRLAELERGSAALAGCSIAVVGPGTEAALDAQGLSAALVPPSFQQEGLLEALRPVLGPGARVWLPRAEVARDVLERGLAEAGAEVVVTPVYRTLPPPQGIAPALEALRAGTVDWILFTSPSTVDNLVALLPLPAGREALGRAAIACLGRITAAAARGHGLEPRVVPERQDLEGLVAALVAHLRDAKGQ